VAATNGARNGFSPSRQLVDKLHCTIARAPSQNVKKIIVSKVLKWKIKNKKSMKVWYHSELN